MAGQMGNQKVKILNLRVIKVVPEKNLLILKGIRSRSKKCLRNYSEIMELFVHKINGKKLAKKLS